MADSPDLSQDQGATVFNMAIAMIVLPSVSVAARLWARLARREPQGLWWDDWLCLISLVGCIGVCVCVLETVKLGLGKHIEAISPPSNVLRLVEYVYVSLIIFDVAIVAAKLSALCFYLRTFGTRTTRFKYAFWVTFWVVTLYGLSKTPMQIAACFPIKKYWDPSVPGRCNDDSTNLGMLLYGLITDAVTDLAILLLPMPVISGLNMKRGKRAKLIVTFACGYVAFILSVGRLATYMAQRRNVANPDFTWIQAKIPEWSIAEIGVSIFSICLPVWFYMLRDVSYWVTSIILRLSGRSQRLPSTIAS